MNNATPIKLKDGTWAALVEANVVEGDSIEVTPRSGRYWQTAVKRVIRVDPSGKRTLVEMVWTSEAEQELHLGGATQTLAGAGLRRL